MAEGTRARRCIRLLCGTVFLGALAGSEAALEALVRGLGLEPAGLLHSHKVSNDPGPTPARWEPVGAGTATERHLNPDGDTRGDGEPDLGVNPALGRPEVVWAFAGPAGQATVWSSWTGTAWVTPVTLSPESAESGDPRLSFLPGGGTGVAWPAGGDVHYRERQGSGDTWTADLLLTQAGETAGRPDVAGDAQNAHVAFPVQRPTGWEIVVESRVGPPDIPPVFLRELLALSDYGDDPELRVEQQDGVFWITWRQDDDDLAWTRLEPSGWTAATRVPVPGGDDIEAARFQAKRDALH